MRSLKKSFSLLFIQKNLPVRAKKKGRHTDVSSCTLEEVVVAKDAESASLSSVP